MLPSSQTTNTSVRLSRGDALLGAVAGILSLALYVATLQPDFGGPEDTPKFQFLGYVLGTAHPPGYPLYVWLSHLFVALPVGSIAYRANLFSGVLAGLSCLLVYEVARQIGARRATAFCASLALAAGASFWRSAVFAEVYSLAAAMAALTVTLLLAWDAKPTSTRLLAGTGAFALGLGNHLTLIGIAPACVLYVFLRHRDAVTLKVVAGACMVLVVGISQYGLIVVRTIQGAPYLESRASSVRDLIGVITAERFAGQRFAFGPWTLLTEHVPAIASAIGRELGVAGVLLLSAGFVAALQGRNGGAALLAGSAAGMLGMVVNISGDLSGFITPVMVLLWPLAALGADAAGNGISAIGGPRRSAWLASGAAIAAAAVMPLANVVRNHSAADQSDQTSAARFFRSAFRQLPDRAGVVVEDYYYDMALHYMLLTGEGGPSRGIARIAFDAAEVRAALRGADGQRRRVFGFGAGSLFLGTDGLQFERTDIFGPPLEEWLRALPRNTVVIGAAAYVPVPLDLSSANHSHARPPGRPRTFEAFAVRAGTRAAVWRGADDGTSLNVDETGLSGAPGPAGRLVAAADTQGARIELGGQQLASTGAGVALAVFADDGRFLRAETFSRGSEPLRVPFQEAFYELTGEAPCVDLTTERWTDVSAALVTGSWIASLHGIGSATIETVMSAASNDVRASSTQLMGNGSIGITYAPDDVDGTRVIATAMTRSSEARPVFRLSLDRPAVQARARVRPGGMHAAVKVCSHRPARPLFAPGSDAGVLRADFESEAYYGAGWSGAERNEAGPLRRGDEVATLLLPLPRGASYRIVMDLTSTDQAAVAFALDGQPVGTCGFRNGARCELTVPAALVRADVSALTLERIGSPGAPRGPAMTFRGAQLQRRSAGQR